VRADVFEQAGELTEIGAAIGLAGNGIREFARLGLRMS
jgi:salicylate hydroxylase